MTIKNNKSFTILQQQQQQFINDDDYYFFLCCLFICLNFGLYLKNDVTLLGHYTFQVLW